LIEEKDSMFGDDSALVIEFYPFKKSKFSSIELRKKTL